MVLKRYQKVNPSRVLLVAGNPPQAPARGGIWRAFDFIKENVVLPSAILYAYVTYVGLLYSGGIYRVIGINPISLYEPTDFLLVGLRHPFLLALPFVLISVSFMGNYLEMRFFDFLATKIFKEEIFGMKSLKLSSFNSYGLYTFLLVMFAALSLPIYAFFSQVKLFASVVTIQLISICGGDASSDGQIGNGDKERKDNKLLGSIIATTQKFLIVQGEGGQTYSVVPIDTVAKIMTSEVLAKTRKNLFLCLLAW